MQSLQKKDNSWKKTELLYAEFITHQKKQNWLYLPRMGRERRYCTLHIAEDSNSWNEIVKKISTNFQVCWIRAVCFHPPLDLPQTCPAEHLASHIYSADQLSRCFILSRWEVPFKRKQLTFEGTAELDPWLWSW